MRGFAIVLWMLGIFAESSAIGFFLRGPGQNADGVAYALAILSIAVVGIGMFTGGFLALKLSEIFNDN